MSPRACETHAGSKWRAVPVRNVPPRPGTSNLTRVCKGMQNLRSSDAKLAHLGRASIVEKRREAGPLQDSQTRGWRSISEQAVDGERARMASRGEQRCCQRLPLSDNPNMWASLQRGVRCLCGEVRHETPLTNAHQVSAHRTDWSGCQTSVLRWLCMFKSMARMFCDAKQCQFPVAPNSCGQTC